MTGSVPPNWGISAPFGVGADRRSGQDACDLAISLDHSAQDCRYLAAAIAAKVPLVTADENFARKARAAGHDARIVSELPA